ncbi:MAG: arylsulfatase [Pseudomonadota bacterium]
MLKPSRVLLSLAIAFIAYLGFGQVREVVEIGPAKQAALAITADLGVEPLPQSERTPPPDTQPNIIVILADDMGWRDIGYNHSDIRTPVMDRLAGEGITLNRFYSQPTCSPTRAALLTGRAPLRHGILSPLSKNNAAGLPLEETTLADELKAAGYQTALTGKWHLGARDLNYHPNARGFDHFYGHLTGATGYFNKIHGGGYDWQRNGVSVREGGYTTHLIADEAAQLIRDRDADRPLFLYVAFGAPHIPNEAPEAAIETYSGIRDRTRRVHAAMVSEMDIATGEIHEALVDEEIEDNTLIWFMSDNGGLIRDNPARFVPEPFFTRAVEARFEVEATPRFVEFVRHNLRHGGSDNRPLRGAKQTLLEGGVRVPSFLYWPGTFDPKSYNYMVTVQDVMPTLLDVAGIQPSGIEFDGQSVWTGLTTDTPAATREYIIQTDRLADSEAIYRYPFKLIVEQGGDRKLYDVEADPFEQTDIARDNLELVAELTSYLDAFPRGQSIAVSFQDAVDDPDFFGGEEDREPWAERAYGRAPSRPAR